MKSQSVCALTITLFVLLAGNNAPTALAQGMQIFEDSGVRLTRPGGSAIPVAAAVGDLNDDGLLDIGTGNHCYDDYIFINMGDCNFVKKCKTGGFGNPCEAIFADMDGDGDLDFVTGDSTPLSTGHVVISINDGTGAFTIGPKLRPDIVGWRGSSAYVVGDFTGDGLPDIAVGDAVLVNEGGLNFSTLLTPGVKTGSVRGMEAGDVDRDGDLDISASGRIWLNDGTGLFVDSGQRLAYHRTYDRVLADFNGDGYLDLVMSEYDVSFIRTIIFFNDGSGEFFEHQEWAGHNTSFAAGDFNRDGCIDLIASANVYLNDGTGTMIGPVQCIPVNNYWISVGDVDNDGWVDLVIPEYKNNGWTHIWLNVLGEYRIEVDIDIKPGSYPNAINLGSHGLIPVAILSSEDFDAASVDPATVNLAGALVALRGKDKYMAHEEDVDADGMVDLVVQVVTADINPSLLEQDADVTYAVLTGKTYDGVPFQGQDEIIIVPPEQ